MTFSLFYRRLTCSLASAVIGAFFVSTPQILLAQETRVIPPSPETTSLFKFSETPVSQYSGLANTTIPFYEINLKGLKIHINISYFGRGINVEETSSRVGLGWALNYGGMVARQVRGGRRDESGFWGYLSTALITMMQCLLTFQNGLNTLIIC